MKLYEVNEVIWNYMELYGIIWNYMEIYGDIWRYMEIYGDIWRYMEIYRYGELHGVVVVIIVDDVTRDVTSKAKQDEPQFCKQMSIVYREGLVEQTSSLV